MGIVALKRVRPNAESSPVVATVIEPRCDNRLVRCRRKVFLRIHLMGSALFTRSSWILATVHSSHSRGLYSFPWSLHALRLEALVRGSENLRRRGSLNFMLQECQFLFRQHLNLGHLL